MQRPWGRGEQQVAWRGQGAVGHMASMQPSWASGQSQLFAQRPWRWSVLPGGMQSHAEGEELVQARWQNQRHSSRAACPCYLLSHLPLCPPNLTNTDTSIKQFCAGSGSRIYMAP